jgi:hypothetical protein
MKRILVVLGLISATFASTAWATQHGPGCGLGAKIWEGSSGVVSMTLAATTNVTAFQTFAITSGTSGCHADGVILRDKEQEAFVATNLSVLNQEMAQGQGQHVAALAALMGCPAALHGDFASMSQESYGTVFAQADTTAPGVLASLKAELGRRPVLASTCSRLS